MPLPFLSASPSRRRVHSTLAALTLGICLSSAIAAAADPGVIRISKSPAGYRITLDDTLFTEYHIEKQKSFLYPEGRKEGRKARPIGVIP